ncbi:MAG: 50S ribosomal protein L13 [Candidatus Altiarchaeota archaeon]|nr:50S ribosomal protein L13 [Candidatus Altiarchaeota archaeon]
MIMIDAEGAVLGRLASNVAKRLLLNEEVMIFNAEKIVITGNKTSVFAHYKADFDRGHRYAGPFFPKEPHLIVKRTIRGMLPWKKERGKVAFKKLRVHIGIPEEFSDKQLEKISRVSIEQGNAPKFVRMGDVSRFLGWNPKM